MKSEQDGVPLPDLRLDGRLIVVTGSSEGIGRAFAVAYARSGAEVVLVSRRPEKLAEVQATVQSFGGTAHVIPADLSRMEHIQSLPGRIRDILGERSLSLVLVNNAGFGFTKPATEVTESDWDRVIDLQVKGTFFCSQGLGRLMMERGYGKIINLSSTWSASTDAGKSVYGMAKAAVTYLTAALSTEWAPMGVRVNALAPTTTLSENTERILADNPGRAHGLLRRIKLGRFAEPQDLLGAALFLASSASDFMTGQTLFIDGGWNALG
jgi:2-deoxy-D-gluconate 3-dehydrogenase